MKFKKFCTHIFIYFLCFLFLGSNLSEAIYQGKDYKIAVVGIGYVGLSNAVLLSQNNKVYALDVNKERVEKINSKQSPIKDKEIEEYLQNKKLDLTATTDKNLAYNNADFVIISVPTDYDEEKNFFDTSLVEGVIKDVLSVNKDATIVIKSTIPIGYTNFIRKKFKYNKIIFSPEFLREGKALYDNLHPSRIIVGCPDNDQELCKSANTFGNLLRQGSLKSNATILLVGLNEAESIKLFSNTYLAMRVSYFNEVDTFCQVNNLNAKQIIDGVGLDPRIGNSYNNPSFGYGGYCFPKDTKQLLANFSNVPNNVVTAVVSSNETRKNFVTDSILKKSPKVVGAYGLAMKSGSDNFRKSAIIDVIEKLKSKGVEVVIYEPTVSQKEYLGCRVCNDLQSFKDISDVIIANRYDTKLDDVKNKVYCRDLYLRD